MIDAKISGFYDEISSDINVQINEIKNNNEIYLCPRTINKRNIVSYSYDEFMNSIKLILDKNNIKFSSIGSPIGKININDEVGFLRQKEELVTLAKIAKATNTKYIRIFSFFVKTCECELYKDKVISKLKELLDAIKDYDCILLHENEKGIFGYSPENSLMLYKEINDPKFRLCFDASNYIQCGFDSYEAFMMLKEYTDYYHIKDCDKETKVEVPLGLGDGNYSRIFNELNKMNYKGFMTLEPHTYKYSMMKKKIYFIPFIKYMKKYNDYFKAFKKIDNYLNKGYKEIVSREEVFLYQYNKLKEMINEANNG